MDILLAIAIMALGAIVLGAALGFAAIKFKVEGDPLVEKIEAILPQTQCGQCGFPGCKPYAEAIVNGEEINKCPPGGAEGVQRLADLLGREVKPHHTRPANTVTVNSANAAITSSQASNGKSCGQNVIAKIWNLRSGRSNQMAWRPSQLSQGAAK